jgi:hypothetical protein
MSPKTFEEFRREYEVRHPASVPRKKPELSPYPRWLSYMTLLMFFSSAMLSGVHTIPVVRAGIPPEVDPTVAGIVSGSAFISVEIAILLSAYAQIGGGGFWVNAVLGLATITALAANVYSVLRAYQETVVGSDTGTLLVAIIIGIVAPGIALLSGKLYVNMHRADRQIGARSQAQFDADCKAWDKEINEAWDTVQARVQTAVQVDTSAGQPSTPSVQASSKVEKHYQDHPADLDKQSIREIADMLGVSKSTVANVRGKLLSNGHSLDGE